MLCRLRFAGKRTRRRLRLATCCPFGIKLERNDVSEVVLLQRGADLEADLTLCATHELALNQAAILQFASETHMDLNAPVSTAALASAPFRIPEFLPSSGSTTYAEFSGD